jgi:hypothetical protein
MRTRVFLTLSLLSTIALGQQRPCDILSSGGSPCVAAHSLIRALYSAFSGPLYTVRRNADNATLNISATVPGGFANTAAQDAFCAPPGALPPLNSTVTLQPARLPALTFRHCDAQGFVTPTESNDDHHFTLVPALNGAPNAVSFRSVNFPLWYLSRVAGAEPGRAGVVEAPAADAASWAVAPAPGGGAHVTLTWLGDASGAQLALGANLTGSCAGNYRSPSASVYVVQAPGGDGEWVVLPVGAPAACDVLKIFDQSPQGNHLDTAPAGGAAPHPDKPVAAGGFPATIGGARVYGGLFLGGMGYRIDNTSGVAKGNDPETIYAVVSGKVFNNGCCFGSLRPPTPAPAPRTRSDLPPLPTPRPRRLWFAVPPHLHTPRATGSD